MPHGFVLQHRDEDVLRSLDRLRFLRSAHVHALHFTGVTRRVAQTRLQRLFEQKLVDRYYLPVVLDRLRPSPAAAREPVYALSTRGARLLSERGLGANESPRTRFRHVQIARPTLEHDLVVSEFLVALQIALQGEGRGATMLAEAEHQLWRKFHAFRGQFPPRPLVVPDGAATIALSDKETPTLYLEVVRADVRGGVRTLRRKLERYLRLQRAGYFASVFQHRAIRAVLFLTPSETRARHLAELARDLPQGRRFFWFGSYGALQPDGRLQNALTAATILDRRFVDGTGEEHTLHSLIGFGEGRLAVKAATP